MESNLTPAAATAARSGVSRLAQEVDQASEAILAVAREHPERLWTARELRDEVQNGWAPAAVMIAINRLVALGKFDRDRRRRIRYLT